MWVQTNEGANGFLLLGSRPHLVLSENRNNIVAAVGGACNDQGANH
jgi:hypothetical protein